MYGCLFVSFVPFFSHRETHRESKVDNRDLVKLSAAGRCFLIQVITASTNISHLCVILDKLFGKEHTLQHTPSVNYFQTLPPLVPKTINCLCENRISKSSPFQVPSAVLDAHLSISFSTHTHSLTHTHRHPNTDTHTHTHREPTAHSHTHVQFPET